MIIRNLTCIFVFILLTCFTTFSQNTTDNISLEVIELPEELQNVLSQYEKYWQSKEAKKLSELFTTDGYILRPFRPPTQGRKAIEEAYKNSGGPLFLKAYDFEISGDLAFIIGSYAASENTPPGGKFTLVLKKVNDQWLIHSDMDNGNFARN